MWASSTWREVTSWRRIIAASSTAERSVSERGAVEPSAAWASAAVTLGSTEFLAVATPRAGVAESPCTPPWLHDRNLFGKLVMGLLTVRQQGRAHCMRSGPGGAVGAGAH